MKGSRVFEWVLLAAVVLAFIPGLLYWSRLPEQMPIHWGLNGEPNGFAPKIIGVFLLPALSLFLYFFMRVSTKSKNNNPFARALIAFGALGLEIWIILSTAR